MSSETTSLLIYSTFNESNMLLLSDNINSIKNKRNQLVNLELNTTTLTIVNRNNKSSIDSIDLHSVIGTTVKSNKHNTIHELIIFYYVKNSTNCLTSCCIDSTIRSRHTYSLFYHTDRSIAVQWSNAITNSAYNVFPLPKDELGNILPKKQTKVLVYVNPFSGKGSALKQWNKVIKPMFEEANVDVILVITQYRNHASEHISKFDLSQVDLIATVSGDGVVYEVINGITGRLDGELLLKTIPLAPLPGGSANGLAKSITFESNSGFSMIDCVFIALKGKSNPLDLSIVQTLGSRSKDSNDYKSYHSFLMLGWGLVSDVDILSESLRFLGELRLHIAGVYYIINRQFYRGRLSLYLANNSTNQSTISELPKFNEPLNESNGWLVIDSDFLVVWVVQTSHTGSTIYSGPGVTLDDGVFTIIVAERFTRFQMLNFLLNIDTGDFVKDPNVGIYKALAYRLEPLTEKGLFALDGEVVEYGPIQGIVKPGAARVNTLK